MKTIEFTLEELKTLRIIMVNINDKRGWDFDKFKTPIHEDAILTCRVLFFKKEINFEAFESIDEKIY
jgi:hypothetical protein